MRPLRPYCVAIALLLCSSGLAVAAGKTAPVQRTVVASDNLVLTGSQESLIWHKVARQRAASAKTAAASSFTPSLWGPVPASMTLHPFPANITTQIPMVRAYRYTTLGNALLLVNPTDRRVVDIITP